MTSALLTATLVVVAAIVVVLVIYLLGIIVALAGAKRSLAKLAGGLVAIRDHTAPLGNKIGAVNGGLTTLLQGLLGVNGDLAAIVRVAKGGK
ncbi:MAG: hypothetical protein ACOZJZ_23265 [Pseudomonadota bacterium]|jgi:hypothetical protein